MFTSLFTNLLLYLNLIYLSIEFKLKFELNLFVKEMNLKQHFSRAEHELTAPGTLEQPEFVHQSLSLSFFFLIIFSFNSTVMFCKRSYLGQLLLFSSFLLFSLPFIPWGACGCKKSCVTAGTAIFLLHLYGQGCEFARPQSHASIS